MAFSKDENIMLQNESDYRKHQMMMALGGYTKDKSDFFDTEEYKKLIVEFIYNDFSMTYSTPFPYKKLKLIKKDANKIIMREIKGSNLKVPFIKNSSKLKYKFVSKHSPISRDNIEEYIKFIEDNIKYIDITDVPIKWRCKTYKNGQVNIVTEETNNLEIAKKFPYAVSNIQITNQSDITTSAVINHEMVHILLDRTKGIIENILHDEILSIYMELLSAYRLDDTKKILKYMILQRLLFLKSDILQSYVDKFNGFLYNEEASYIDSSLYAFALIDNYINSNKSSRKSIRKEINKTINGDRTLEDTLAVLGITEEEGCHIIKDKIKKIMR